MAINIEAVTNSIESSLKQRREIIEMSRQALLQITERRVTTTSSVGITAIIDGLSTEKKHPYQGPVRYDLSAGGIVPVATPHIGDKIIAEASHPGAVGADGKVEAVIPDRMVVQVRAIRNGRLIGIADNTFKTTMPIEDVVQGKVGPWSIVSVQSANQSHERILDWRRLARLNRIRAG
jgi:hypothetical protein